MISFFSGVTMAASEPKFTIESKTDHYEIRKYAATLVAETKIEADFEDAGNRAFRILADYIFGNNKSKLKIAMIAPVTQLKADNQFVVQFTMPEEFNVTNLPEPSDSRVHIREIPPRDLAVFSYSGTWSENRYKNKLSEFVSYLKKDGVQTIGEPIFARFNPPFMPWFLRRNEIWIEVKK
jgi:hypothetical protein